jgi:hypothetical protein
MRSPKNSLLSSSGKSRIVAAWTIVVAVGLIAVLRLNWTTWTRYYQGGDEPTHELQIGVEIFLVLGGFLLWCGGLVVIEVVLEVLERRRGSELADTPSRRDPGHARGFLPKAGSGRPPYDGKWPG